jgi:hypothetical protein
MAVRTLPCKRLLQYAIYMYCGEMERLGLNLASPILQVHLAQVKNWKGVEGTECSLWVFSNCPKLVFDNWRVVAACF